MRRRRRLAVVLGATAAVLAMTGAATPRNGPNLLAKEKSPYLLQHANNPVDWRAWNPESLAAARAANKPIFLSVGYSTCHWCHVMEHESFEDVSIAEFINAHFIAVKVDREERPDVDALYMGYVQSATGRGGWPMTVFLTPELKPFFGGTYFPPADFQELLSRIAELWNSDRTKIDAAADQAGQFLASLGQARRSSTETQSSDVLVREAYHTFESIYDRALGGFGGPPKFPRPAVFAFLLRYFAHAGIPAARDMVLHTLRAMADGGMYDQIGGGFHRYSVDERWHVPHFEKMLYDQAQLAMAYVEGWQVAHDERDAATARGIFTYVLRDMTGPGGGFYAAEDADSFPSRGDPVRREGAFYTFTSRDFDQLLGADAPLAAAAWGVEPSGNAAASDPHGEFTGRNVLYAAVAPAGLATTFHLTAEAVADKLDAARRILLAARSRRPRPRLDDKILTGWNGLMISAFARAAAPLAEPRYLAAARGAAEFVLAHAWDASATTLHRRWREGEAAVPAFLDDYAFLVQGLLDLYEADGDRRWLDQALVLQAVQDRRFWDPAGGYFVTDGQDPSVIARLKEDYDGAEPAGNSIAALNLERLAGMTDRREFKDRAAAQRTWAAAGLAGQAHAQPQMLCALLLQAGSHRQVVLAGDPASPGITALRSAVRDGFHPGVLVLYADGGPGQARLAADLPYTRDMSPKDGRPRAYLCLDRSCDLPTDDPAVLKTKFH